MQAFTSLITNLQLAISHPGAHKGFIALMFLASVLVLVVFFAIVHMRAMYRRFVRRVRIAAFALVAGALLVFGLPATGQAATGKAAHHHHVGHGVHVPAAPRASGFVASTEASANNLINGVINNPAPTAHVMFYSVIGLVGLFLLHIRGREARDRRREMAKRAPTTIGRHHRKPWDPQALKGMALAAVLIVFVAFHYGSQNNGTGASGAIRSAVSSIGVGGGVSVGNISSMSSASTGGAR
jgi:hypothetical protein